MADYTTIADSQVDPEAPITSELMSALRDNPLAIAEGATGAPKIQTAGIQDAAVTRDKLFTATASASGSISSGQTVSVVLSTHSFFPTFNGSNQVSLVLSPTSGSADAPRIGLRNGNPDDSLDYSVSWRYINT